MYIKTFKATTPSNRQRCITYRNNLSSFKELYLSSKIHKESFSLKRNIKGIITKIEEEVIQIDIGLQVNIEISKKELIKILKIKNIPTIKAGDFIKLKIKKLETNKGDQIVYLKSIESKIEDKYRKEFEERRIWRILSYIHNKKQLIKGIILNRYNRYNKRDKKENNVLVLTGLAVGIVGLICFIKNNSIKYIKKEPKQNPFMFKFKNKRLKKMTKEEEKKMDIALENLYRAAEIHTKKEEELLKKYEESIINIKRI
jgi:hypothetical protein